MTRHQRTNLTSYGGGELDGSKPGEVAKMRPLGQARFMHDIVDEDSDSHRDDLEDAAIFNMGSHGDDPCETFNDTLGKGRLGRGRS